MKTVKYDFQGMKLIVVANEKIIDEIISRIKQKIITITPSIFSYGVIKLDVTKNDYKLGIIFNVHFFDNQNNEINSNFWLMTNYAHSSISQLAIVYDDLEMLTYAYERGSIIDDYCIQLAKRLHPNSRVYEWIVQIKTVFSC